MQKLGKEAGQALERAAQIQADKINEPDDAANTWQEAFKSYRKTDPQDAARVLQFAINHYTSKVSLQNNFHLPMGLILFVFRAISEELLHNNKVLRKYGKSK